MKYTRKFSHGDKVVVKRIDKEDKKNGRHIGDVGIFNHYFANCDKLAIVDFSNKPNYCLNINQIVMAEITNVKENN